MGNFFAWNEYFTCQRVWEYTQFDRLILDLFNKLLLRSMVECVYLLFWSGRTLCILFWQLSFQLQGNVEILELNRFYRRWLFHYGNIICNLFLVWLWDLGLFSELVIDNFCCRNWLLYLQRTSLTWSVVLISSQGFNFLSQILFHHWILVFIWSSREQCLR